MTKRDRITAAREQDTTAFVRIGVAVGGLDRRSVLSMCPIGDIDVSAIDSEWLTVLDAMMLDAIRVSFECEVSTVGEPTQREERQNDGNKPARKT